MRESTTLTCFIGMWGSLTVFSMVWGLWTYNTELITDALHTAFHCAALVSCMVAMDLSKRPPSTQFSYGYDRYEVLTGFTNAVFVVFVSLFMFFHAIHHFVTPRHELSAGIVTISAVRILADVFGVLLFYPYAVYGYVKGNRHAPNTSKVWTSHHDNMHAVFLHIICDLLSSAHTIIVSNLFHNRSWSHLDPFISFGLAGLFIYLVTPLCLNTGKILLQTSPSDIRSVIDKCLREATFFEGVLETRHEHFWTVSPGKAVGTLTVRVRNDADEQATVANLFRIFAPHIWQLTVQVEKDPPIEWFLPVPAT
eukprot:GILK01010168.1.p1 GENE.GILK01010168.1~~GILK01010168.1.p1  ORF type:complete len:324 (+),score=40.81 GILK01010168.1:47-973(+)